MAPTRSSICARHLRHYRRLNSGYLDGLATIGHPRGTPANDQFSTQSGCCFDGLNNNFGELKASQFLVSFTRTQQQRRLWMAAESPIDTVTVTLTGTR